MYLRNMNLRGKLLEHIIRINMMAPSMNIQSKLGRIVRPTGVTRNWYVASQAVARLSEKNVTLLIISEFILERSHMVAIFVQKALPRKET